MKRARSVPLLDPLRPLDAQLDEVLQDRAAQAGAPDLRDALGKVRNGRPKAAEIARHVYELAHTSP